MNELRTFWRELSKKDRIEVIGGIIIGLPIMWVFTVLSTVFGGAL